MLTAPRPWVSRSTAACRTDPAAGLGDATAAADGGQDPRSHEIVGTSVGAAASSFLFFASGAAVPVLPFVAGLEGGPALLVAGIPVGAALMLTGATVGVLSGGPPLRRALRQLAIAAGAAAVTYALGALVNELVEAADDKQLTKTIARYGRVDLLRIDELGYMAMDRRGAELLFQVLTEREEKNSVAIASNESFGGWTKTFTDPRLCAAIVDRLTFGGNIIETGTDSYRLARSRAATDT
jgi:hypothetical protein